MAALFTIFNSFQGLFIFIFYCIQNEKVRKEYSKLFASLHCVWNSRAPASSAVESSSANSVVGETRKTVNQSYATTTTIVDNQSLAAHNQEPMIAPNTGSALTPTLRRVTSPAGAKYFITGKADSANSAQENYYGFRRLAEGVRNKQKQRCKAHCDHILKNPLVEHIYECIDDAPYTVTLFAASACCSCRDDLNARLQSEANASECDDRLASADNNSANAFQELKLPAIVCDNSTVISKSNCKAIDSLPYSPLISTVIPTGSKKIVGQPHAVLPSVVGHSNGRTNIVCGGKSSGENNLAAQHAAAEQNGQEAQSHQILAMLGSDNKIVTSCAAVAAMEQGIDI
ncbi:adhesion G protein-coupled receptor L2-like isoform X3 [Dinothrombium tinctorium]|uniref:Adhesion G protein-coupled receptor L2-like isoform X3 n=1 Tax=Dinothrombium tinctorium TaxID=1965070 RepID=A0A3S3NW45_9ACAR|nr:adhesion G protein-coupled receptor L2-like isoform X3 [Dinothrombium tinctorium]